MHSCRRSPIFDPVVRGDLVLPDRVLSGGYLGFSDGKFGFVGADPAPEARAAVDASGKLVLPRVADGHVHAGSSAGVERLRNAKRAAATGRMTTIVDMPFDEPDPADSVARFRRKVAAIERLAVVDVALYATARKGTLIPGGDADFIIVEPTTWTFDAGNMASEVKWSPYDGMRFGARVEASWVRGRPVFEGGRVVAPPGEGAFVRPV